MGLSFSCPLHLEVLFASLSLILLLLYKLKKSPPPNLKLPPGETGWPIIGETLEFTLAGRTGKPQKFVNARMQKHSPDVFKTSLFGQNMAVFCGATGNKFLFSNDDKLVTNWYPHSTVKILLPSTLGVSSLKLLSSITHKILPDFLKPEALQNFVPITDSMAVQHVDEEWAPNSEVKVHPLSKKYSFAVACRLFMNIDDPKLVAKFARLFALVSNGLIAVPINLPGTEFNRAVKGGKMIREELAAVINQRKIELSEKKPAARIDLLTRMLLYTDENGKFMNEIEIASNILGLLIAGHHTTTALITTVVKYLAEFPDIYAKVLKEQMDISKSKRPKELLNRDDIQKMKYTLCVAHEAMRLTPPAQGTFREAITDFTYAGFSIPKGWKVYWTTHSTHQNPAYFSNPKKFDPSRFEGKGPAPNTFVPFGGGIRMCPGRDFARMQSLVFLHNVVTKFKWEKVIRNEKIRYNPLPNPENGLLIRLQLHKK